MQMETIVGYWLLCGFASFVLGVVGQMLSQQMWCQKCLAGPVSWVVILMLNLVLGPINLLCMLGKATLAGCKLASSRRMKRIVY